MDESVEDGIISAASTTEVLQVASVHNNNNNNAANNPSELNRDATIDSQAISRPKSPVPPKSNSTVANNNNNNNNTSNNIGKNKPKSQGHQQNEQQLPQAGHHQFRTPQQFLRHRPAAKKNKPWNKRQHKTGKHNSSIGSGLNAIGLANSGADLSSLHNTKADLENIQNQLGPGVHYLPNIHGHNNHPGHRGSCVGLNANSAAGGIAGVGGGLAGDCNLSHGLNPKAQSYKKMPPHRGHNSHHALCPGGAHNSLGGGLHAANPTGTAGNMNSACCPLNACCNGGALHSHTKEKDGSSIGGGDSGSGGSLCGCVCTLPQCCIRSKFFLNDKRPRKEVIVPPTKFLLGGNISDPLNLTSLQNECLSNASSNNNTPATTPRRSPITTPPKVEVIIPPNIRDPLHLLGPVDSREYEKQLTSPMKRCGRLIGPASGVGGVGGKGGDGPNAGIGQKLHKNRNRKNRKMQRRRRHESCNIPMVSSSDLLEKSVADVDILDNVASGHLPATESKTDDASKTCDNLTEERLAPKSSPKSANVQNVASGSGERASLRLDLTSGSMNNSSSSSIGGGSSCGGGRKRKISEGNHSNKFKKFSRLDTMDKIVSPVVPQPGAWKRPPRLLPSGARKPKKRSISEAELLSPVDESTLGTTTDSLHSDHLDVKSEIGIGSPLSTVSATTCGGDAAEPLIAAKSEGKPQCPVAVAAEPSAKVQNLLKMPKIQPDGKRYRFGNFDRYAGYRNVNEFMDVRLEVFQRNFELFHNKDILDIGCNVGCMTISVAKNLAPKSILGIDIDGELISRARHNLRTHVRIPKTTKETTTNSGAVKVEQTGEKKSDETGRDKQSAVTSTVKSKNRRNKHNRGDGPVLSGQHQSHHHHSHHFHNNFLKTLKVDCKDMFPISFPLTYGPVPTFAGSYSTKSSTLASDAKNTFPENVFFRQSNYVLKDEAFMCNDMQQYDLILCLSVTKWIHLNFGDAGLKMAFKRMFNQLRPGGKLILEAQNWPSYKKRKNLTEEIYKNYMNIEFFPNKFHEYLLSSEVGFSHSYTLGVPQHMSKGFCRPIQLYAKGDFTPNHIRWSDAYYPQTPYEAYRGIYATMPPRPAGMSSSHPMSSSVRSQAYDTPHFTGGTSGPYSNRQTPMHQPTSQYYNPLETDSYLPSYDMEYLNHTYVFESPLYQTAWSPPASLRNSSSHTPHYGSVREAELDGSGASYPRHVYPPNEDTTSQSPNANGGGAFSSIRDPDTDDSNQIAHVYATNCSADGVVPSDDESPVITQPTSPSTI